jgi:hypothetical protein
VPLAVEHDEAADPVDISFLGFPAISSHADGRLDLIEQSVGVFGSTRRTGNCVATIPSRCEEARGIRTGSDSAV